MTRSKRIAAGFSAVIITLDFWFPVSTLSDDLPDLIDLSSTVGSIMFEPKNEIYLKRMERLKEDIRSILTHPRYFENSTDESFRRSHHPVVSKINARSRPTLSNSTNTSHRRSLSGLNFDGDNFGDGVSFGDQYTGGLMDPSVGGDVYGWGANNFGQLGVGSLISTNVPQLLPVLRNKRIAWLSAGSQHSLGITDEGLVYSWGRDNHGQLGIGTADYNSCDQAQSDPNCRGIQQGYVMYPSGVGALRGERTYQISSKRYQNLVVVQRGVAYGWGMNSVAQLGTEDLVDRHLPTEVARSFKFRFVEVAAGGEHSLGVTPFGEVYAWGSDLYGQLGQDTLGLGVGASGPGTGSIDPIIVPTLSGRVIISIAAGWAHCMALADDGSVWMWGRNNYGQLGLGDLRDRSKAVRLQDSVAGNGSIVGRAVAIAAGHSHSVFLSAEGVPYTVGRNDAGQLGVGDTMHRNVLSRVVIPKRIWCDTPFGSQIPAAYQDLLCVGSRVRAFCGRRCRGTTARLDCGASDATLGLAPGDCEPLMPISQRGVMVQAGEFTTYLISDDLNLYAWGLHADGQVGIGPQSQWGSFVPEPQLVVDVYGKNVTSVAGGQGFTVARVDREDFHILDSSPISGAVSGGTALDVIGQGFNTFNGNLTCRLSWYSNGTVTGQALDFPNASLRTLDIPAERFSNFRIRCITPDVRFKTFDGQVDQMRMLEMGATLTGNRSLTVVWRGSVVLQTYKPLYFVYTSLAGVISMIPNTGPIVGGSYILIQGYAFYRAIASDVRVRFGDDGNNWMRGCILSDTLISVVSPPSGPSDSGVMDYDGACVDLCPTGLVGLPAGCVCSSLDDPSPLCVRGIVKAALNPLNRANRRDRCPTCKLDAGPVAVRVSLNGFDYTESFLTFTFYAKPSVVRLSAPFWLAPFAKDWDSWTVPQYGGPSGGGTVVDIHGSGFTPAGTGTAICVFGCSYASLGQSVGPRCSPGTARHSLLLLGRFIDANHFRFAAPAPSAVWDLIHYGTWFLCPSVYGPAGCPDYNATSGVMTFVPRYEPVYAPTFIGFNQSTGVTTSCIEACESRIEFVNDSLIRCTSPPRALNPSAGTAENTTLRLKLNGQDVSPECLLASCALPEDGAAYFIYYEPPRVDRVTPNGSPVEQTALIYVSGAGFSRFAWFPRCLFGRQVEVVVGNSTTYPGWVGNSITTNTSAWVINDTLLVCFTPILPQDAPHRLDVEYGQSVHYLLLGYGLPGAGGDGGVLDALRWNGRAVMPFTISLNSQNYIQTPGAVPFPLNPRRGTVVSAVGLQFIFYPHPVLHRLLPAGGVINGTTQVIINGTGFQVYNELGSWVGQYDAPGTVNTGSPNPNWFNLTSSTQRPPFVPQDKPLGWPQGDRNVGARYSPGRTTSVLCRFGTESTPGYTTTAESLFYGHMVYTEAIYSYSVWADYLDGSTLRCRAPAHAAGNEEVQIALNGRDFPSPSSPETLRRTYAYYRHPRTYRVRPSGGPIDGGSQVVVAGDGLASYGERALCRFGSESEYDPYHDLYVAWINTTTPATVMGDGMLVCMSPPRFTPVNSPFGVTLNGQDYNMIDSDCTPSGGPDASPTMWDDPARPLRLVESQVIYRDPNSLLDVVNRCPFVFYSQPVTFGLYPAGTPVTGGAYVRIYGRRFDIFSEDVRCKFGISTVMWTQAIDRQVGTVGRGDELNCPTPPHLYLTLSGPGVSCTLDCQIFPSDSSRCQPEICSFNTTHRILGFKLAVAEIVGQRDVYGDINVLPADITIENFLQTGTDAAAQAVNVLFCVHCVIGNVGISNVQDSLKIIAAVRNGALLKQMRRYKLTGVTAIQINGEPTPLLITLNGQDYTRFGNHFFSFYLNPTINSILPAGGPLVRYDIADSDHSQPTLIEIYGTGFKNYDEESQCSFDGSIVPATVVGDRLMLCESPWPGVVFIEGSCGDCVLDVWIEVTLNGQDFSVLSGVNFRYYLQPTFSSFSPLGGPVTGGTPVTFKGKGFNRFNDGTLRVLWGVKRTFAEEMSAGLLAFDDFDPQPPDVAPLDSEYGLPVINDNGTVSSSEGLLSTTFEGAQSILISRYQGSRSVWDYRYAVISDQKCGAMDLPATTAKVRIGFLPGDNRTKQTTIQSQALYFSGRSRGVFTGRYAITRSFDISRGAALSIWLRRGNASAPLSCEQPDPRDELDVMLKVEEGTLAFSSSCVDPCSTVSMLSFSICGATQVSLLSVKSAVKQVSVKQYPLINKTISENVFEIPKCNSESITLQANRTNEQVMRFAETTDTTWLRLEIHDSGFSADPPARLLVPLDQLINPTPGAPEIKYTFQQCTCIPTTGCATPPCPDSCDCNELGPYCVLEAINPSVAVISEQKLRMLSCYLPTCLTCSPSSQISLVQIRTEYIPDSAPPQWSKIADWRRLCVFATDDDLDYTFFTEEIYRNERGQRSSSNRNQLAISTSQSSMISCPRFQSCFNRKSRLMISQPSHGQGDYDNWAIDDFNLETVGGIVSDSQIVATSPPAHVAIPLTEVQRQDWKRDGTLLGNWMRPININIALNNQSYEPTGKRNFCRYPGDSKEDPDNAGTQVICDATYFNWDESNWLFVTEVEPKYTNWWEKEQVTNWGASTQFQQVQSAQFFYYQHPIIQNVVPSGGPTQGGTYVTVFGTGFAVFSDPIRTPKCKFGTVVVEARVFVDGRMTCTTPSTLVAGYVDIVVSLNEVDFTSPGLGKQYSVPFLFYAQPTISSMMPNSGPSRGGTLIAILGTGFAELPSQPACRFYGVNDPTVVMDVQGVFLNDTMIHCRSPPIAYLCTPSTFCDQQTDKDPNWRGCTKWLSCPFNNVNGSAGCPWDGCEQREQDGSLVKRDQPGEDVLFDTVIQLSLNAFCCVRDLTGKITQPCIACSDNGDTKSRCSCVGDFTTVETDQDSAVLNTFTFYREAEINNTETMNRVAPVNPMLNGDTQNVITVIGMYFRNTSLLQCGYKAEQEDVNVPTADSVVYPTGPVFDSYYYQYSTQMLCTAPDFPGQPHETTGNCEVFLALNGVDTTRPSSGGCPPGSCISMQYYTPISPEKRMRQIVAIVVPTVVFLVYVYFQRQRYLQRNAKYVSDVGGEWEKPSLREALHWQNENQVRKYGTQLYPLWRTSTDQLSDLGTGIGLYFGYLKYMTKYFLIMSLLCIPSLVICSAGHAYPPTRTDATTAIRSSIGSIGLGQTPATLTVICLPGGGNLCAEIIDSDASFLLAVLDCVVSLVFIVATWRLKVFQDRAIVLIDEDTITAADYTVLVDNIPGDATDPDELRAFFSKYGEVADVAIGLNNGKLIELFQKRGKLEIAIDEQAARLKLYKLQSMQIKLKKTKRQQQRLDATILRLRAKTDFKSVCAFVTFNDEKGQQDCLEAYSRTFLGSLFRSRSKLQTTKKFRRRYNLIVKQSPEPSNILWENLQHKGMEIHVRTLIAFLVSVVLLVSSFYLTLWLKLRQDELKVAGGDAVCLDINVDDPGVKEFIRWSRYAQPTASQGTAQYQSYLACYCGPYGKMLSKEPEFCNDYVINEYKLNALSVGSVAAVLVVNAILQIVLKSLAAFVKPHTISSLETAIASRIFFTQWINTAIIVVLINANLQPYISEIKFLYDAGFLNGQYSDTTEDWFVVVGTAVVSQSISASFVPNLVVLAQWPIGFIKQHLLKDRQMTQKKMNKLFEGSEYLLSARYAALLNILWVILTYSSAIPIMNFFGVVFFSTAYWCDKAVLLRACKKPAQYDEQLAVLCTNMMSVGMIVHLAISVWFFGYLTADLVDIPLLQNLPLPPYILKRVVRKPATTVLFFLLAYVAFEILARTVGPALLGALAKQFGIETEEEAREGNPPFFEALENQEISGLDTYNIKKNARYRDAFSSDIVTDDAQSEGEGGEEDEEDEFADVGGKDDEED